MSVSVPMVLTLETFTVDSKLNGREVECCFLFLPSYLNLIPKYREWICSTYNLQLIFRELLKLIHARKRDRLCFQQDILSLEFRIRDPKNYMPIKIQPGDKILPANRILDFEVLLLSLHGFSSGTLISRTDNKYMGMMDEPVQSNRILPHPSNT